MGVGALERLVTSCWWGLLVMPGTVRKGMPNILRVYLSIEVMPTFSKVLQGTLYTPLNFIVFVKQDRGGCTPIDGIAREKVVCFLKTNCGVAIKDIGAWLVTQEDYMQAALCRVC
jgi:hypothetical protein